MHNQYTTVPYTELEIHWNKRVHVFTMDGVVRILLRRLQFCETPHELRIIHNLVTIKRNRPSGSFQL